VPTLKTLNWIKLTFFLFFGKRSYYSGDKHKPECKEQAQMQVVPNGIIMMHPPNCAVLDFTWGANQFLVITKNIFLSCLIWRRTIQKSCWILTCSTVMIHTWFLTMSVAVVCDIHEVKNCECQFKWSQPF